jgi:hypothetical protein
LGPGSVFCANAMGRAAVRTAVRAIVLTFIASLMRFEATAVCPKVVGERLNSWGCVDAG